MTNLALEFRSKLEWETYLSARNLELKNAKWDAINAIKEHGIVKKNNTTFF